MFVYNTVIQLSNSCLFFIALADFFNIQNGVVLFIRLAKIKQRLEGIIED